MSTAILISGQLRTFSACYPSIRWHVLRHFPDCHFFITVQDEPSLNEKLEPLRAKYGEARVHVQTSQDPKVQPRDDDVQDSAGYIVLTDAMAKAFDQAPYANAAPAAQLLMQHWYQNEVWKFFQSQTILQEHAESAESSEPQTSAASAPSCKNSGDRFDTIIRLRPDQFFHSFDYPREMLKVRRFTPTDLGGREWEEGGLKPKDAFTPWWGRFGGINDRFAILGREAARAYFTVYEQIPALLAKGCPFHPESLVKAALLEAGCTIHETLRTEFTTLRQNGQHRPPEIAPWDLAHAALRAA